MQSSAGHGAGFFKGVPKVTDARGRDCSPQPLRDLVNVLNDSEHLKDCHISCVKYIVNLSNMHANMKIECCFSYKQLTYMSLLIFQCI